MKLNIGFSLTDLWNAFKGYFSHTSKDGESNLEYMYAKASFSSDKFSIKDSKNSFEIDLGKIHDVFVCSTSTTAKEVADALNTAKLPILAINGTYGKIYYVYSSAIRDTEGVFYEFTQIRDSEPTYSQIVTYRLNRSTNVWSNTTTRINKYCTNAVAVTSAVTLVVQANSLSNIPIEQYNYRSTGAASVQVLNNTSDDLTVTYWSKGTTGEGFRRRTVSTGDTSTLLLTVSSGLGLRAFRTSQNEISIILNI